MKQHLWINGENVETNHYKPLHAPYSQEVLAEVAVAEKVNVTSAIGAAEAAFLNMKNWAAHERASVLEKVVELMKQEKEECAKIIAQEAAKPIKLARAEVDRTIMTYLFAAQEARRISGETIPLDAAPGGEGRVAYTIREALGVIAAITPFNFPMNLVAHKVGPAIASGNTVVLKPASQTPLSAYKIADIFNRAGLPAGALNVVTGSGRVVGDVLLEDERIKMVTFTGSPEVGTYIRERAGLKKVTLELGSNSAVIVDEDADVEKIVPRVVSGSFAFQGQVCISVQRIYVHEQIFEEFVRRFKENVDMLVIGDPLEEKTDISAMISMDDVNRAKDWVGEALQNGAQCIVGGKNDESVLKPTVLVNVSNEAKVSCEEVFAPIVMINSFTSVEEAIHTVNESKYGLQAGYYTNNLPKAFEAVKKLHVGGVMINDIPTFRVDHMPYGGVKMSGTGREGIKYAVEEMTELKLVTFNLN